MLEEDQQLGPLVAPKSVAAGNTHVDATARTHGARGGWGTVGRPGMDCSGRKVKVALVPVGSYGVHVRLTSAWGGQELGHRKMSGETKRKREVRDYPGWGGRGTN